MTVAGQSSDLLPAHSGPVMKSGIPLHPAAYVRGACGVPRALNGTPQLPLGSLGS